jgi:hypothetical protein
VDAPQLAFAFLACTGETRSNCTITTTHSYYALHNYAATAEHTDGLHLLTFLPSYLLTFLPSYLLTFLPSYLLTFSPSYLARTGLGLSAAPAAAVLAGQTGKVALLTLKV